VRVVLPIRWSARGAHAQNGDFIGMRRIVSALYQIRKRRAIIVPHMAARCYAYGCMASGRTDMAVDGGLDSFDVYAPAAVDPWRRRHFLRFGAGQPVSF